MSDPPTVDEVLVEMVRADIALREDKGGRDSFRFPSPLSRNPVLRHNGFYRTGHEHGWIHVPRQVIEDMRELGLVRVKVNKTQVSGPGRKPQRFEHWLVDVSTAGVERYRLLEKAATASSSSSSAATDALDWLSDVLPVLQAAYEETRAAAADVGASQDAVNHRLGREPGDAATVRVLVHLERAGYVRATIDIDQSAAPQFFVLTEKALQVVAGWPGGDGEAGFERLLLLLEQRIEEATSPDERSKWERARDGVLGAGRDVMVEVLAAIATRGASSAL